MQRLLLLHLLLRLARQLLLLLSTKLLKSIMLKSIMLKKRLQLLQNKQVNCLNKRDESPFFYFPTN
jgi:hypothetical protein